MRMWSRGLGSQNLGIECSQIKLLTLQQAIDYMPKEASGPLLRQLGTNKVIAFSGKMLPPTGWEFVITMGFKDLFFITVKIISWKIIKLFW